MANKNATQTVASAADVEQTTTTFDLGAAYRSAREKAVARTTVKGQNVPFKEVKEILVAIAKEETDGKLNKLAVGPAAKVVAELLRVRYDTMEEGGDYVSLRVGPTVEKMTKTEAKDLRLKQLAFSTKQNNIYRMCYSIINR